MNQKWLPENPKILQSSSQKCLFLAWLGSEAPEADFESLPGCFWGVLGRRLGAPWGGSGVSEAFLERSGAASGRFLKGFGCRLGVRMRFEAASGRFLKRFAHFKRFQCALQWRRGISWVMFKVLQRIKTHRYIDISISCFSIRILNYTFVAFRFALLTRLRQNLASKSLQNRFKNRFKSRPRQELIFYGFGSRFWTKIGPKISFPSVQNYSSNRIQKTPC